MNVYITEITNLLGIIFLSVDAFQNSNQFKREKKKLPIQISTAFSSPSGGTRSSLSRLRRLSRSLLLLRRRSLSRLGGLLRSRLRDRVLRRFSRLRERPPRPLAVGAGPL